MSHATHRAVAFTLAVALSVLIAACSETPSAAPTPTAPTSTATASSLTSASATSPSAPSRVETEPADSVAASGEAGASRESVSEQTTLAAETPTAASAIPTATPTAQPVRPATRTVALDPGHGGPEVGAGAAGLAEKDVNLTIALRLATLLRERGIAVVLTRDSDRAVSPDYTGNGYPGVGRDLQARVDVANAARADLFISIHNNGSNDSSLSGTEVWYSGGREFGDENRRLARLALAALVKSVRATDYPVVERGIKDDSNFRTFQGRVYNIYVLGPGSGARPHTPTAMPGILGETLFLSNAGDAARLRQERTLDAIVAGYRDAVVAYFAGDR